jgi:Rrf2 family protein
MGIIFSRQCEYGVQAILHLAGKPPDSMTSIKELAVELGIPYHYLAKILQILASKGILRSRKGPAGGFALSSSPNDINLFTVVEALDGQDLTRKCVLGFPECEGENPCAVHHEWGEIRERIYKMLLAKSVGKLSLKAKLTD